MIDGTTETTLHIEILSAKSSQRIHKHITQKRLRALRQPLSHLLKKLKPSSSILSLFSEETEAVTQNMEKGCKVCENYKEHYYQDHINGKCVEFYEIMHGDFSQHLKIPKKFAYYCRQLPETVGVMGPNGKIWPVGLKETNGGMLLKSGWKEFVEAHHILENYLLFFKYDGKYCFDISIFDDNRCKKEASYLFMESNPEEGERRENSLEILKVKKSHRKVVVGSSSGIPHDELLHSSPFLASRKISGENEKAASKRQRTESSWKRRTDRTLKLYSEPKNNRCNPCPDIVAQGTMYNIRQESVGIHSLGELTHPDLYVAGRRHLTYEEEERALQLVFSVKPNNPCFISFLQQGSVHNAFFLYAPAGFRKVHLPSEDCIIILRVPGQSKRWCITTIVGEKSARLCWKSFALDNDLQVGDACLFELINDSTDTVMIVNILRAEEKVVDKWHV